HVTAPPYFLVMELLPGESLRRRLRRDYRLALPDALWVARQTAEALAALHRAGFLHGDVKPDNVRLVGAGAAVPIDLGFAHPPRARRHPPFPARGCRPGPPDLPGPQFVPGPPRAGLARRLFQPGGDAFRDAARPPPPPAGLFGPALPPPRLRPAGGHHALGRA